MSLETNHNLYCCFSAKGSDVGSLLLKTDVGVTYSYADAHRQSSQIACGLTRLGLNPGDRVTVQVEKSVQALWLYLACLRAGLVFQPLNPAYQAGELHYFLTDAAPKLVVCANHNEPLFDKFAKELGIPNVLTLDADGSGTLMKLAECCPPEFNTVHRDPDDLAALLYSSGTTGQPKGIMLTHRNLFENTKTLVDAWSFAEQDRLLHALPIFHVHGLFVAIGCAMMSGASMCWLAKFDIGEVMRHLPECTVMMGVPTFYTRLLEVEGFSNDCCDNLRLFISGSAPLLKETFFEFEQRTGYAILERYGMTETGMNTSNPLTGERRCGTVGLPLPGIEVRAVNESGEAIGHDEIGDLQVRGANVFKGYWRKPDKTIEDFTEDGFFNTGDKCSISSDGYVTIVGREKDMIISGGLNVYPKEVELILDELDYVKESAVIGVSHGDLGEAVVAVIVPAKGAIAEPNEQVVIAAVKEQLAKFKAPKKVLFVDELPRNTMGKVQKNVLRERYAQCCDVTP